MIDIDTGKNLPFLANTPTQVKSLLRILYEENDQYTANDVKIRQTKG